MLPVFSENVWPNHLKTDEGPLLISTPDTIDLFIIKTYACYVCILSMFSASQSLLF